MSNGEVHKDLELTILDKAVNDTALDILCWQDEVFLDSVLRTFRLCRQLLKKDEH